MSGIVEKKCSLLLFQLTSETGPKIEELSQKLENGSEAEKVIALKKIIHCIIAGLDMNRLTMQVIKFCLRSKCHELKKLLQIFWEVLDKKDKKSGKLKPEMILVCNHLLQDLKHANEFIRGSTARLLCRIDESEILEQLIPQLLSNLNHRHSYVRKNSVLSIMSICRKHPHLIPDAPQRMYEFLMNESNVLAKRNAFLMLTDCDLRNALDFFISIADKISSFPETMQISILELMRKVCRCLPVPKSIFVKCAAQLLDAQSNAVIYEAANTLLSLTPLDSAVNRALEAYTHLLQSESDQNVKLIVINRLDSLKVRYARNLKHVIMDIMRGLATPNLDIRKQILSLVLNLSSSQNIADIITCLKKEMMSSVISSAADINILVLEYRNLLVESIHECAIKYPIVCQNTTIIDLLISYLSEDCYLLVYDIAYDVILFIKEIMNKYPDLRESILGKLLSTLSEIKSEKVYRIALWICGEYISAPGMTAVFVREVFTLMGQLPLMMVDRDRDRDTDNESRIESQNGGGSGATINYWTRTVILDDGTYAQETMSSMVNKENDDNIRQVSISKLRQLIVSGEYYVACVLAQSLLKLLLKLEEEGSALTELTELKHELKAKSLLVITSVIRFGTLSNKKMSLDCQERMLFVLNCLLLRSELSSVTVNSITHESGANFSGMLVARRQRELLKKESVRKLEKKHVVDYETVSFDSMLNIRQLRGVEFSQFDEDDKLNIVRAAGNEQALSDNLKSRLSRVVQLTGFSDPIYAEACVTVHQFDIMLDFLIINNTVSTLQNLTLELHTSGDLKLVEKPSSITLGPHTQCKIAACIKVSSTENGVIFGNICYQCTKDQNSSIVVMNCIHMDIIDYVDPYPCSEEHFRQMWTEFEWENKVPVKTDICDLQRYVAHISAITNMQLLTPIDDHSMVGTNFLAANLHAKSIFGEHALMNVSIELKNVDTANQHSASASSNADNHSLEKVCGHIRIRCKSQGIALSLGEKITNKQRDMKK